MTFRWKEFWPNMYTLTSVEATFEAYIWLDKAGYYKVAVDGHEQPEKFMSVQQAKRWIKKVHG